MVDPTGFARLINPNVTSGLDYVRAMQAGENMSMERQRQQQRTSLHDVAMQREQMGMQSTQDLQALGQQASQAWEKNDRQGLQRAISSIAAVDPKQAQEVYNMYGTMDRTNFVEGAYAFAAAAGLPMDDIKSQNKFLEQNQQTLNNPNHPFHSEIESLKGLTGEDRQAGFLEGMNILNNMNAFPKDAIEKDTVQSSKILPDGTVVSIMRGGDVNVTDATGAQLTGDAAKNAIEDAETFGVKITGKKERAKKIADAQVKAYGDLVETGKNAASELPSVLRSIELLDSVRTGGISGALVKAKQFFGVEGADEAELSFNLSQNILKQLKPTFGAQFTKAEGDWLKQIEASIGKSVEGNKAILNKVVEKYKFYALRARDEAVREEDHATVRAIDSMMERVKNIRPTGAQAEAVATPEPEPTAAIDFNTATLDDLKNAFRAAGAK